MKTYEVAAQGWNGRFVVDRVQAVSEKGAKRIFLECYRHFDLEILDVREVED